MSNNINLNGNHTTSINVTYRMISQNSQVIINAPFGQNTESYEKAFNVTVDDLKKAKKEVGDSMDRAIIKAQNAKAQVLAKLDTAIAELSAK